MKEVITIDKIREQLLKQSAKFEKQLRQEEHKYQRIEQQIKYLKDGERKKHAHRLIIKGAVIESVAPSLKDVGEREFYELIERIFDMAEVKTLLPKAGE